MITTSSHLPTPLITSSELAQLLQPKSSTSHTDPTECVVVDLRWRLGQPGAGYGAYLQGHIPGAIHIDLDTTLSDHSAPSRGRHPLPQPETFAHHLAALGIGSDTFVIVYDDMGGTVAARLWWMLSQWFGHHAVAVLDGGLKAWQQENRPLEQGAVAPRPAAQRPLSTAHIHSEKITDVRNVEAYAAAYTNPSAHHASTASGSLSLPILIDARAPERYAGTVEPIDPKKGHIPGAINAPTTGNLGTDPNTEMRFLSPSALQQRFAALGLTSPQAPTICYCGSGVTACHTILALTIAGYTNVTLYPGSWSEWCSDDTRPIATK